MSPEDIREEALELGRQIHCLGPRPAGLGELARIDTQLLNLSEILAGLTGRTRRLVMQKVDIWLDRRLEITGG